MFRMQLQKIRIAAAIMLLALQFTVSEFASAAIKYSQARLVQREEQLLLIASANIELNSSIESGLSSGVPLYFNAILKVKKSNAWWPDKTVYKKVYRYSLVYYELTRHYRVSWLDESRSKNFRSLLDALASIGTVRSMPTLAPQDLLEGHKYHASLRLALDQNALPLALRPLAFVNSGWRLKSEEYQWQIN